LGQNSVGVITIALIVSSYVILVIRRRVIIRKTYLEALQNQINEEQQRLEKNISGTKDQLLESRQRFSRLAMIISYDWSKGILTDKGYYELNKKIQNNIANIEQILEKRGK
jgi:hypothetical protein